MNTKKQFKSLLFVIAIAVFSFSFSVKQASAVSWGLGLDSSGGLTVGVGSSTSAMCATTGNCTTGGWALSNPYGLPSGSLLGILSNILFWLLSAFSILGIIGFVLSGIWYLLSAGEESMAEKGKEGMKWSIIGLIVGLSGFIIMQAISLLLSGSSSNF